MGLGKCHPQPFPLSSLPLLEPTHPAAPTDLDLDSSATTPAGAESFRPAAAALENGQNDAHFLTPFGRGGARALSACPATDLVRMNGKPTDLERRKAGSLSISLATGPTAPIPAPPPADPAKSAREMEEEESEEEEEEDDDEEEGRRMQPQGRSLAQSGQRRRRRSRRQRGQTPNCGWEEEWCFRHLHPTPSSSSIAQGSVSSAIDRRAPPILAQLLRLLLHCLRLLSSPL